MEPKKIKKLVFKKETVSSLSNNEQNLIRGGYGDSGVGCLLTPFAWTLCGAAGSCPANACDPPPPDTNLDGQCYSKGIYLSCENCAK